MRKLVLTIAGASLALSGCVSNKTVQTVEIGDEDKSCAELRSDLSVLGAKFEEAKDEQGVTGKNVGLAIVFWPGIIVNESQASKNEESIDRRITHLTGIYNKKCLDSSNSVSPAEEANSEPTEEANSD